MPLNTEAVIEASLHKKPVFTFVAEPIFPFQLNYLISIAESQNTDHQIPNRPHVFQKYFSTCNKVHLLKYE